jgi:hypothetical protein
MNTISVWVGTLRASLQANLGIAVGVWWNVALLAGSLAALPIDRRTILGLNPWIKPIKFELSVIVFLMTIAVMLAPLPEQWLRAKWWIGWGIGVALIVENSVIALQSARGVRSHMNYSTPLDGSLFGVMGLAIAVSTVLSAWLLVLWCRTDAELPPAVVWGIRLGLLMLLAASAEGVRMVLHGAHTVGAEDGSPGLAFVNWSTHYGDLRIAHFFALHALQIFPLVGLALAALKLRQGPQLGALFAVVAVYSVAVWWLFAEAMRGVPLVR